MRLNFGFFCAIIKLETHKAPYKLNSAKPSLERLPHLGVVVKGKCQGLMFSDFVSSYSLGDHKGSSVPFSGHSSIVVVQDTPQSVS